MSAFIYSNPTIAENEEYVHWRSEDVDWSGAYVNLLARQDNIYGTDMLAAYTSAIAKQIEISGASEITALKNTDATLITQIMDQVAKAMNNTVDKKMQAAFNDALVEAHSNKSFLSNGSSGLASEDSADSKQFKNFMDSIYSALQLVSNLSPSDWQNFTVAYKAALQMSGKSDIDTQFSTIEGIINSNAQLRGKAICQSVIKYLKSIAQNRAKAEDGAYDVSQMSGSINNIMSSAIGEPLGAVLQKMKLYANDMVVDGLQAVGAKVVGNLKSTSSDGSITSQGKVDLVVGNAYNLSVAVNSNTPLNITVTGKFNTSVKWYKDIAALKGGTGNNTFVDIGKYGGEGSSNGYVRWLRKIYGETFGAMYGVYNTLAFNRSGGDSRIQDNYRIMRSSLIRTSLVEFLAGKGTSLGTSDDIDLASIFMINGEAYSIANIIVQYLNEIARNPLAYGDSKGLVYVSIKNPTIKNNRLFRKGKDKTENAIMRSDEVKEALNKIGFSVQINYSKLKQQALASGARPIGK